MAHHSYCGGLVAGGLLMAGMWLYANVVLSNVSRGPLTDVALPAVCAVMVLLYARMVAGRYDA